MSREYVLDRGRALNVEYAAQSLLTLLWQQLQAKSQYEACCPVMLWFQLPKWW
ncbi:MAG: hypothetical protein WKG07_06560 [Hymenobacter sp.]